MFVLWVGWYGFNGGSTLGLTADVPAIILNTTLAATFGGLVAMALTWWRDRRPDVVMIMNGSLAGLVAVTASANLLEPLEAALVGGVGAVVMLAVTVMLERGGSMMRSGRCRCIRCGRVGNTGGGALR